MNIDLEMVEVDGTIFISGTNLGPKIDTKHKGGCKLYYDTEKELTFIVHKGKTWMGKVKGMILKDDAMKTPVELSHAKDAHHYTVKAQASGPGQGLKMNAQVETPIDKVQGTPKRKPRYQGDEV